MPVERDEIDGKSWDGGSSREIFESALAYAVECARARYVAAETPESRAEAERSLREALAKLWDQMLAGGPSGRARAAAAGENAPVA